MSGAFEVRAESSSPTAANCEELLQQGAIAHPDPDISGAGVVLAFILSAYITFFMVLVVYLGGLVDSTLLRPVDRQIFHIQPYSPSRRRPQLHASVRKAVLALSDQQIVTGIAIMGAGFQGLRTGSISVYHFQIVLYLAWMSSSVHLSAITLLGTYLQEHRGIMIWRLCGMSILLVMLIIGLVPTISNDWGIFWWNGMVDGRTGWAIPAKCFWGKLWGDGVGPDAPLGFIILAISYIWKVGGLFSITSTAYNRWVRSPLETLLVLLLKVPATHSDSDLHPRLWLWLFRLILGIALPLFVILECVSSFAASLWISLTGLLFGTIQVLVPRTQMQPLTGSLENTWGFGQLVPLILLIQPLGAIMEHVWTKDQSGLHRQDTNHTRDDAATSSFANPFELDTGANGKSSLIQLISGRSPISSFSIRDKKQEMKALLFSSKLFATLVWLVQAAVVTICVVVFYFDAETIGNQRSNNWEFILEAIAAFAIFGFLMTVVLSPFSRTGKL
ncbi:hypothetical protein JX266_011993 [Neoarthrinium moseri]|nr:hypothetical protein JX266_011993 [Neoarthrinium moseri]